MPPRKRAARKAGWTKATPDSIAGYLATVSADKRAALQKLRRTIRAIVPRADECISYRLPAFRLDGRMLVWFGAAANHCSFYPGAVVEGFRKELAAYDTSKGTIRFQPDHPLPASLVRKLVNARIAANVPQRRQSAARATRRRSR